jgi:hypothetical protein
MALAGDGGTIGDVECRCQEIGPPERIRPALLHLLWSGRLRADLTTVLSNRSVLEAAG